MAAGSDVAKTIWVADDDSNEHLLLLLAAEEASGVRQEFAFFDSGAELMLALAAVEFYSQLPDLIVLDLRMPLLDGHGTLKELQAHPVLWQIPVVVLTSSTRASDRQLSLERGACWFETKPSAFSDLVALIERLGERSMHPPYELPHGHHLDHESPLALLGPDLSADIEDHLITDNRLSEPQ